MNVIPATDSLDAAQQASVPDGCRGNARLIRKAGKRPPRVKNAGR